MQTLSHRWGNQVGDQVWDQHGGMVAQQDWAAGPSNRRSCSAASSCRCINQKLAPAAACMEKPLPAGLLHSLQDMTAGAMWQ